MISAAASIPASPGLADSTRNTAAAAVSALFLPSLITTPSDALPGEADTKRMSAPGIDQSSAVSTALPARKSARSRGSRSPSSCSKTRTGPCPRRQTSRGFVSASWTEIALGKRRCHSESRVFGFVSIKTPANIDPSGTPFRLAQFRQRQIGSDRCGPRVSFDAAFQIRCQNRPHMPSLPSYRAIGASVGAWRAKSLACVALVL